MTYGFLLESVWHPPLLLEDGLGKPLPPELELQALWFSGAFGRDFRTRDGRRAEVVQFGEWNRGAGPDFVRVAVEIDGGLRTGDLELDGRASDWERHGHGSNPAFANVVLHVVFQSDARERFTKNLENREVPQIAISPVQLADALGRPAREVAIARPGRCVAPLKHLSAGAVARLLEDAARHRAGLKVGKLLRAIEAHGRDQALFQATAETLGYRGNDLAMRMLSQRVGLSVLRKEENAAEAILFGSAGFLSPDLHERAPEDTRDYLRTLWETWWKRRAEFEVSPERAIGWKTHGQRPANHPHRRIGALARLVGDWTTHRRLALEEPLRSGAVLEFLQGLEHDFWSRRHTLGSKKSTRNVALFGRAQGLELLANHWIPLAMHEGRMSFGDYLKLRSASPNEKVKRCALRLFGSLEAAAPWLKRVCHHQGLLQVYQDFCLEDSSDCANCPFPEQLSQWR